MANYEHVLENFKQQWNLPAYDLHQVASSVQALRFADSFLTGASVDNSNAGQFVKWFSRTLSIYFATNTAPNQDGKYMSSFDAQDFYDSFKELVQAKYDADAEEKGEEPLQVSEVITDNQKKAIQTAIANGKRSYKKTLPALWQEGLKDGSMDMQSLQTITSNSFDNVEKKWYVNENEMAGNLTNILAAREAMKQLRASRSGVWGWLWKVIFNRTQNRQEKEYLQQLETQIATLTEKGYSLDRMAENLTQKTVFGKDVNAKAETREMQVEQPQASNVKTQANEKAIQPVASQISEKASSEFMNELAAKLHEELPGNNMAKIVRIWQYQSALTKSFEIINQLNENFDAAVANGGDPMKEMAKVVHGVFKETVKAFSGYMIETGVDKMEGLKIAAELITNQLTAAAIYPNELGNAVNGYIERNLAIYEDIVTSDKEYGEAIEDYKQMLEGDAVAGDDHEPVFNDDNPFVESNVNKSAPVKQQPQINAFSLDKK